MGTVVKIHAYLEREGLINADAVKPSDTVKQEQNSMPSPNPLPRPYFE